MGVPLGPAKGVMDTAAEMIKFCAPFWLRSVCKKVRKLALSFADMVLQPIPCLLGYSQLQNRSTNSDFEPLKQTINALKLNTVKVVRRNNVHNRLSESRPICIGGHCSRKVLRARPTSNGQDSVYVLKRCELRRGGIYRKANIRMGGLYELRQQLLVRSLEADNTRIWGCGSEKQLIRCFR